MADEPSPTTAPGCESVAQDSWALRAAKRRAEEGVVEPGTPAARFNSAP